MCTSQSPRQTSTKITLGKTPRQPEIKVANAVANCAECGTLHYQKQLSCRNCGAYFLPAYSEQRWNMAPTYVGATVLMLIGAIGFAAMLIR